MFQCFIWHLDFGIKVGVIMSSLVNNKKIKLIITIALLVAIYVGFAFYRIRVDTDPEFYDARNPTAFYWTENAIQYHYAELVSQGRPIPTFDPKLQSPEGVKVFENLTILMEYPCGALYRLLGLAGTKVRFHTFTIYFMAFFSALVVFALYLSGRALGFGRLYALLASGLGVFSYVSIGRSIQGFLNEDFSLPLFFLAVAFYLNALRKDRFSLWDGLLPGLFMSLGLAGWHFARFLLLGFVACACVNLWVFTPDPVQRRRQADVLSSITLICMLASSLVPVLSSRGFFISPAFLLAIGAALGEYIFPVPGNRTVVSQVRGLKPIGLALACVAGSVIVSRLLKLEGDYTHVWSLIWNKLKFFGVKPARPGQLDFPARSLWIEAFNSPSLRTFFLECFPLIAAAVLGAVFVLKKTFSRPAVRMALFLAALFFVAYLAIERLGLVANFFLALLAGGLGLAAVQGPARIKRLVPAVFLIAVLAFNSYQGFWIHRTTGYSRLLSAVFHPDPAGIPNWRINNLDLVEYVRHESLRGNRFLTRYSVGPLLFAYAGQAIALQPKFEVRNSRERVAEYYRAIYGSEEDLYRLCREWRMDFFLYDLRILLDASRDSDRWVADRLEIKKDCAAFRLHFAPESLRHFELVYQSSSYRLYRVLEPGEAPVLSDFPGSPVYDLAQYGGQSIDDRAFDDQWSMKMVERIRQSFQLINRGQERLASQPALTRDLLERARKQYPNLIGQATVMGTALVLTGDLPAGLALLREEVRDHPYFALARYNLAYALYCSDDLPAARAELGQCLQLDPDFEPAREMIKEIGVQN